MAPTETEKRRFGFARAILFVLAPFGGGYFLSYLYRTVNSVIGDDLIRDLTLSASDIGLLTAAYLFMFAAFQLPLGVLLDRYGPRRVNTILLLIAATGAAIFAIGQSLEMLIVGRGLIGLGVSAALMASFKAITQWFPRPRWPLINGLFLTIGGLGAIAGTAPVQAALVYTDWRGVFLGLAGATVAVAATIFFVAPDAEETQKPPTLSEQLEGLKRIYTSRIFWSIAPMAVFSFAANLSIQGLWAGLWLRDVAQLDKQDAAWVLALLNIGMTAGFVAMGVIADIATRRGISLAVVLFGGIGAFILIQVGITFAVTLPGAWLWIGFGFFANAAIVAYPMVAHHFPLSYAGKANTAVNLAAFIGAFLMQYALGWIIDFFPRGPNDTYIPASYEAAFGTAIVLQIAGMLWFLYAYRRVGPAASHEPDAMGKKP
jgi:MFS family permease